ncbi:hypothetical protein IWQ62_002855 [Dispira parvispora]|uniref:HIT-type domain-containing protein n=1 Tax=Dispira parvispora TaxID=1520584 RepID=A0A9W8E729_9FUNG|nr:hypothetical protein IWQ62_002855 [Dispira parvispora]
MSGDISCTVCKQAAGRYKCPTCHIRYCSVACFKTHKEQPCQVPISHETQDSGSKEQSVNEPTRGTRQTPIDSQSDGDDDDQEYLPSPATLEQLTKDPAILAALEDPIIRTLIPEIINSKNPLALLEEVTRDIPAFDKFKDQLLDFVKSAKDA